MPEEKSEKPKKILWSVWLDPAEHEAANRLIDILLKKKLIKNGPKGFVSRRLLLLYLVYAAIDKYKEEIFSKQPEVLKQNVEEVQIQ